MPYVRTARAYVWVDTPSTAKPEKFVPAPEEIRWAQKPLPSHHGLCIGFADTSDGPFVAVKRSSGTFWLAAGQVLHHRELSDWLRAGFGAVA
ncbi:hypothetical protein SAMN05421875_101122 [Acidovorax soli]|uniref:Uncharacterized protein n=1 Tax=Acidovorax soli TaxID=592050 RepID=A0A1H3VG72_9BURK|nr:hypothetical protein SAMN05421875_101122 [Acidovorax soli]